MLEETLEDPLDSKEIKSVNPKGNQPCTFTGRTDAKAETPIFWPPDDPNARKDRRQEEKGATEEEMVGWHHQLNGRESGQTLGDGGGQKSLVCCSSWAHQESNTTDNWTTTTVKPSGPGLFSTEKFLFTNSISLLVTGLFRFSISS